MGPLLFYGVIIFLFNIQSSIKYYFSVLLTFSDFLCVAALSALLVRGRPALIPDYFVCCKHIHSTMIEETKHFNDPYCYCGWDCCGRRTIFNFFYEPVPKPPDQRRNSLFAGFERTENVRLTHCDENVTTSPIGEPTCV